MHSVFCWILYFDTINIIDIHKSLMKKTWYKIIFSFIKTIFIGLWTSVHNSSNYTKCVSLSNQECKTQPILIGLNSDDYPQGLHYYPFVVNLDKRVGSWDTLNNLYNMVCVPNKTEDLNISDFNMITGINESKTLTEHISCQCECKFYGGECNSNPKWNSEECQCECDDHNSCERDYIWNLATCSCENGKYMI